MAMVTKDGSSVNSKKPKKIEEIMTVMDLPPVGFEPTPQGLERLCVRQCLCPRMESNHHLGLRSPLHCPLCYEGKDRGRRAAYLAKSLCSGASPFLPHPHGRLGVETCSARPGRREPSSLARHLAWLDAAETHFATRAWGDHRDSPFGPGLRTVATGNRPRPSPSVVIATPR